MFKVMPSVVAVYSLFTFDYHCARGFKLPHATWTIDCHGSSIAAGSGKGFPLSFMPPLHLPPWTISTTPSRRTTRDNPGLPLPALRSITGLGNDGIFEVDRWTLNLKQGLPTTMQCSTWNLVAYCMHLGQSGHAGSTSVMITL